MFERILNDEYILQTYREIEKYETQNNVIAFHGEKHALSVASLVEKILLIMNCDAEIIEDAKVAALLHDLGCVVGKENHEIRSYEMAKRFIEKNGIKLNNNSQVLDSILNHRNDFNSDNIITRTLVLADKLDIKKDRLGQSGYEILGLRQLQYISDIEVLKEGNTLIINFKADKKLNIDELLSFNFMKKVIKSIEAFANFQNMDYIVKIHDLKLNCEGLIGGKINDGISR